MLCLPHWDLVFGPRDVTEYTDLCPHNTGKPIYRTHTGLILSFQVLKGGGPRVWHPRFRVFVTGTGSWVVFPQDSSLCTDPSSPLRLRFDTAPTPSSGTKGFEKN